MFKSIIVLMCSILFFESVIGDKHRRNLIGDIDNIIQNIKSKISNTYKKTVSFINTVTSDKLVAETIYAFVNFIGLVEETEEKPAAEVKDHIVYLEGFQLENHIVTTQDGYILQIHRLIPHNRTSTKKGVVLLHHGLLGSSLDFLLVPSKLCLPYQLAEQGYDVWLMNARGNSFSRRHSFKNIESNDYWDFSFHEIGKFDLPSTIDYIREVTEGKYKFYFIGYSMGTTALLVLLSNNPVYNNIIQLAVLIAPLAYMRHAKGPIKYLAEHNIKEASKLIDVPFFLQDHKIPEIIMNKYCGVQNDICSNPLMFMTNGGRTVLKADRLRDILASVPSGGSTKTIIHYSQLIKSREFQMFDYGFVGNLKYYGQESPPPYKIEDVNIPVAIFSSDDDWLAPTEDVQDLLNHFSHKLVPYVINIEHFGHLDFMWGKNASELVFKKILEMLVEVEVNSSLI